MYFTIKPKVNVIADNDARLPLTQPSSGALVFVSTTTTHEAFRASSHKRDIARKLLLSWARFCHHWHTERDTDAW
jgi:hypothetical protein